MRDYIDARDLRNSTQTSKQYVESSKNIRPSRETSQDYANTKNWRGMESSQEFVDTRDQWPSRSRHSHHSKEASQEFVGIVGYSRSRKTTSRDVKKEYRERSIPSSVEVTRSNSIDRTGPSAKQNPISSLSNTMT